MVAAPSEISNQRRVTNVFIACKYDLQCPMMKRWKRRSFFVKMLVCGRL